MDKAQQPPKLRTSAEKDFRTTTAVEVVTPDWVKGLKKTSFQRPITENKKLLEVAEEIKATEEIPGTIQIGVFEGNMYKLDGQHRLHAFLLSGAKEALAVVIYKHFDDEAKMGLEFIKINSAIAKFRPDDILRSYEESSPPLRLIRKRCAFVGYDNIRRGSHAPILSMSLVLRAWSGSVTEVPTAGTGSAYHLAQSFTIEDAEQCSDFLVLAEKAWGSDPEYARLWTALNLGLCMWLYRRTVIAPKHEKVRLSPNAFRIGMSALSVSSDYLDWLVGRKLGEGHRSPAYGRIKTLVARRLGTETGKRVQLPSPDWSFWTGTRDSRFAKPEEATS